MDSVNHPCGQPIEPWHKRPFRSYRYPYVTLQQVCNAFCYAFCALFGRTNITKIWTNDLSCIINEHRLQKVKVKVVASQAKVKGNDVTSEAHFGFIKFELISTSIFSEATLLGWYSFCFLIGDCINLAIFSGRFNTSAQVNCQGSSVADLKFWSICRKPGWLWTAGWLWTLWIGRTR